MPVLNILYKNKFIYKVAKHFVYKHKAFIKSKVTEQLSSSNPELKVLGGPFQGLVFPSKKSVGSSWIPKIAGTYEAELFTTLEKIKSINPPSLIINIGSAEGFYATGMLKLLPSANLVAFEANPKGQELTAKMAQKNGVDNRITVNGLCDKKSITSLINENRDRKLLIICDCEGCEFELLNPSDLDLSTVSLLVEVHDNKAEGPTASQIFHQWYKGTHEIEYINSRPERPNISLGAIGINDRKIVLDEGRSHSVGWVYLQPKKLG